MKIKMLCLASVFLSSLNLYAEDAAPQRPTNSGEMVADGGGVQEVDKPLNVTGQSRNFSMMMVLKGDKDRIDFVDIREDYRDQVPETVY